MLSSIEICAGAGGQALGLEQAGFHHEALVEIEPPACATLKLNRPNWNVIEGDVRSFSASEYHGKIDLLAGGVPCPPFSVAGKQLGADDERDLFPEALRLIGECEPRAVLIENVKGIFYPKFDEYRAEVVQRLSSMGYKTWWRLVQSSDYGVSQLRPRAILVGIKEPWHPRSLGPNHIQKRPRALAICCTMQCPQTDGPALTNGPRRPIKSHRRLSGDPRSTEGLTSGLHGQSLLGMPSA